MFTQIAFCYICLSNTKHLVNMDRVGNDRVKLLDMLTYLTFETVSKKYKVVNIITLEIIYDTISFRILHLTFIYAECQNN